MSNTKPNIQDTIQLLKKLKTQVEKLSEVKIKQASQEIDKYASYIEKEKRRRGMD